MGLFITALLWFAGLVAAVFALYGFRQTQFWRWKALRWAKVLGACAVGSMLITAGIGGAKSWSEKRTVTQQQVASCRMVLHARYASLETAAIKAEKELCAKTEGMPHPWWDDGKFYCSQKAVLTHAEICGCSEKKPFVPMKAPDCNVNDLRELKCESLEQIERFTAFCGRHR